MIAWQHKAITWTNFDLSLVEFCGIHLTTILQDISKGPMRKMHIYPYHAKFILGNMIKHLHFVSFLKT